MDIRSFFANKPGGQSSASAKPTPSKKRQPIEVVVDDSDDDFVSSSGTTKSSTATTKVHAKKKHKPSPKHQQPIDPDAFFSSTPKKSEKPKSKRNNPVVAHVVQVDEHPANNPSPKADANSPRKAAPTKKKRTSPTKKKPPAVVAADPPKGPPQSRDVQASASTTKQPPRPSGTGNTKPDPPPSTMSTSTASPSTAPPDGAAGCLSMYTFVVTGVPELSGSRVDLEYLIKDYGGVVRTAVSKKTNFLVAGKLLEDGRPATSSKKYQAAEQKNVQIIDEAHLFKMINDSKTNGVVAKPTHSRAAAASSKPGKQHKSPPPPPVRNATGSGSRYNHTSDLWSDRYKPQTKNEIIGNAKLVNQLTVWLNNWESVHLHKTRKVPYTRENPGAKAVLLSGPPGIGKSSTAFAIGKTLGYDIFELNASDARSKRSIKENLSSVVGSRNLNYGAHDVSQKRTHTAPKRLVVMDEVDGMSSDDRGGIQELIKVIKTSNTPIICICNDRQKSSVRSLANHCYDLRFARPDRRLVTKRMLEIAAQQQMKVEPAAMEYLVQSTGNDIRQILTMLQMWKRKSNSITFKDLRQRETETKKDDVLRLNNFVACSFIMNESWKPKRFKPAFDAFFTDIDLIPLMIAENYTGALRKMPGKESDVQFLERMSRASDAVCDADIVSQRVRGKQEWSLLPMQAALNVRVSGICKGGIGNPNFPEWLGKNSNRNKRKRLLGELCMHLRHSTSTTRTNLRKDYLTTLKSVVLGKLLSGESDAPSKTIDFMDEYGLSRDDVFETLQEFQFETMKGFVNPFTKMSSKLKSSFTREYNKRGHRSQALVWEEPLKGIKGKKRKAQAPPSAEGEEGDANGDEVTKETEEAEIKALAAAAMSKSKSKKGKAKGGSKKRKTK